MESSLVVFTSTCSQDGGYRHSQRAKAKDGWTGQGRMDWPAIRHATSDNVFQATSDNIFQAIKTDWLAKNKSKNMKAILDTVYLENEERCKAHTSVIENSDLSADVNRSLSKMCDGGLHSKDVKTGC